MPKKARVFSREMKLAAIRPMMAGECVSALAREPKLRRHLLYLCRVEAKHRPIDESGAKPSTPSSNR